MEHVSTVNGFIVFFFGMNMTFYFQPSVCEQAYSMAQNLDPNSNGRGVLQFKTGLMSVIKVIVVSFCEYIGKVAFFVIYFFSFSCDF